MNNLVKKTAFTVGACILSVLPAIAQDAAGKQQQPAAPVAVAESQPKVLVRVTATTSARKYLAKHKADIVSADKRSIVVLTEQSAIGALKKAGLKVTETESFAAPSSTARTFQQQDRRYHDYMRICRTGNRNLEYTSDARSAFLTADNQRDLSV